MKKLLIIILALLLTTSTLQASDGQPSTWAQETVTQMINLGIVPERLQHSYQAPITREEFAELLVNTVIAKINEETNYPLSKEDILNNVELKQSFVDADEDHIKIAYMLGSINGISDTHFAPDNHITRQEASTMLANTIQYNSRPFSSNMEILFEDHESIADWAYDGIDLTVTNLLMQGTGENFEPLELFTREQAIMTMKNFYLKTSNSYLTLRGIVPVPNDCIEMGFVVGKDFVAVKYSDQKDASASTLNIWNTHFNDLTSNPTMNQAYITLTATNLIESDLIRPIVKQQDYSVIDCQYMYIEYFTDEYLINYDLSSKIGYVNTFDGHQYKGRGTRYLININPSIHQCETGCGH
ncbi:S-layer homology domain-containing protein [Vallitalea okinawensis]|uniref:S-layer homology domain-containing protein n=1 Tax=Vallitalea okinawensis TaxID=2078660 RepID=UPI000CFBBF17|nr:S-layer homology domain-containing protein [Vallitalea okinawensis]